MHPQPIPLSILQRLHELVGFEPMTVSEAATLLKVSHDAVHRSVLKLALLGQLKIIEPSNEFRPGKPGRRGMQFTKAA